MQNITIYLIALFLVQFAVAQNSKNITGKVVFKQNAVRDVEVINWNKKTITISDAKGIFTISASEKDSLFFLSKNHLDRKINISKSIYESATVTVQLVEKTEDLEEVQIIQNQSTGLKVTQMDIDAAVLEKRANRVENKAVYMGTIENGTDFVRIFNDVKKYFKKKKEVTTENKNKFNKYVQNNFETAYFIKNLDIKPDDIQKFIAYCNTDVEATRLVDLENILTVMDFLKTKSITFKQL